MHSAFIFEGEAAYLVFIAFWEQEYFFILLFFLKGCIVVTTYRSFGVVFKATWQILNVAHCGAHTRKQNLTLTFSRKNGINHIWDVF